MYAVKLSLLEYFNAYQKFQLLNQLMDPTFSVNICTVVHHNALTLIPDFAVYILFIRIEGVMLYSRHVSTAASPRVQHDLPRVGACTGGQLFYRQ